MAHRGRPFAPVVLYHRDHGAIPFTDEKLYRDALESGEWGTAPYAIPETLNEENAPSGSTEAFQDQELKPWQKAQAARKAKAAKEK